MRTLGLFVVCLYTVEAAPPDNAEVRARWLLEEAVKQKDPETRRQATVAFGLLPVKDPLNAHLATLISDGDVHVRLAAVAALADLAGPAQIRLLEGALEDKAPEVAFAAARALYGLKQPAGRQALLNVIERESKTESGFFTREMRSYTRQLRSPSSALLFAVRQGIGFAPVPGLGYGVNAALSMMSDNEFSGRAVAVIALAGDTNPAVRTALREALQDEDWPVRAAAIHVMAETNQAALRSRMHELLDDKKNQVRFRAAAACIRLTRPAGARR